MKSTLMKPGILISALCLLAISACSNGQTESAGRNEPADSIVRIEMNLSAFGVEADDFPSINASMDFQQDTSFCSKSFYNPAFKASTYVLSKNQMDSIVRLLRVSDLGKLKVKYESNRSDQPRSITKIYTTRRVFTIDDYGLEADDPLKELYRIVYRY